MAGPVLLAAPPCAAPCAPPALGRASAGPAGARSPAQGRNKARQRRSRPGQWAATGLLALGPLTPGPVRRPAGLPIAPCSRKATVWEEAATPHAPNYWRPQRPSLSFQRGLHNNTFNVLGANRTPGTLVCSCSEHCRSPACLPIHLPPATLLLLWLQPEGVPVAARVEGRIPPWLTGSFVRNGPGEFSGMQHL